MVEHTFPWCFAPHPIFFHLNRLTKLLKLMMWNWNEQWIKNRVQFCSSTLVQSKCWVATKCLHTASLLIFFFEIIYLLLTVCWVRLWFQLLLKVGNFSFFLFPRFWRYHLHFRWRSTNHLQGWNKAAEILATEQWMCSETDKRRKKKGQTCWMREKTTKCGKNRRGWRSSRHSSWSFQRRSVGP